MKFALISLEKIFCQLTLKTCITHIAAERKEFVMQVQRSSQPTDSVIRGRRVSRTLSAAFVKVFRLCTRAREGERDWERD